MVTREVIRLAGAPVGASDNKIYAQVHSRPLVLEADHEVFTLALKLAFMYNLNGNNL